MDMTLAPHLGKSIQTRRRDCGYSQEQLARATGIPYTTLTKIESGVIHKPSVFAIYSIAKALQTTVEDLMQPFTST